MQRVASRPADAQLLANAHPHPAHPTLPAAAPQWVGKAAETTSSTVSTVSGTVQSVTTTSIRRVVDDIKTLANVGACCCRCWPWCWL